MYIKILELEENESASVEWSKGYDEDLYKSWHGVLQQQDEQRIIRYHLKQRENN